VTPPPEGVWVLPFIGASIDELEDGIPD